LTKQLYQIHGCITTAIAALISKFTLKFATALNLALYFLNYKKLQIQKTKLPPTRGLAKNWLTERSFNFYFVSS